MLVFANQDVPGVVEPFLRLSSAFTMVTLEQIRRKVISAVSWMPSTSAGFGQSALPARMAP